MTLSENTCFHEMIMNLKHTVQVSGKRISNADPLQVFGIFPKVDSGYFMPGFHNVNSTLIRVRFLTSINYHFKGSPTQAILFFKSMSESVGSDIERL